MARKAKFKWSAVGVAMSFVVAALFLWIAPSRQTSSAQDAIKASGPLISRGFTDAPMGTVLLAGNPEGGSVLTELRIGEGQLVKRDEIIAVLSNYEKAKVTVRTTEADLEKATLQREAMVSGYRTAEIAQQEVVVKGKSEELKLKTLELQRSGKQPDMKELELNISQQDVSREQAKLRVMKETLTSDLALKETDISILKAKLDNARAAREDALVRSPLNGVIVQVLMHQGERVSAGIAKIVDMSQMRVFADVDEVHLGRLTPGGRVEITFRGSTSVYKGKIARVAPTVKRMQRVEPDGGSSTDGRVVQVEIELDDPASMPQVLGRETRVTFL
jgi:HlyD family secretion protein